MDRRELLKLITLATGAALIGSETLITACTRPRETPSGSANFTSDDIALLDEVAETIIPRTDTPGAKDAHVGKFMTVMVDDCYYEADTATFMAGIAALGAMAEERHGKGFMDLSAEERTAMLTDLDAEARAYQVPEGGTRHYFTMMKQLTLLGYYTSEPGMMEELQYVIVPGRFDPCVDYVPRQRNWSA